MSQDSKGVSRVAILVAVICGLALAALIFGATLAYDALSGSFAPQGTLGAGNPNSAPDGVVGSSSETAPQEEQIPDPSKKAPDFTMADKAGNTVSLSDLEGKPVVLNFWASWCPPCKAEMPDFDKVYLELGDEVVFVMLNLADGQRETAESGLRFVSDEGFSFPVYFDTHGEGALAYSVRSIPTTVFIDRDGQVAATQMGAIDENTLRKGIELIRL